VSRDLLQLENPPAQASPFLISPSAGGAFPFPPPPPPSQFTHVPLPLPPPSVAAALAASQAASGSNGAPARLKTFSMPTSSLLSRVQAFLPQLAQANAALEETIAREGAEAVNIEHLGDDGASSAAGEEEDAASTGSSAVAPRKPHIEMDLSLGVLEVQQGGEASGELPELSAARIVIPGVTDPAALGAALAARATQSGAAAAGSSDEGSDDEDGSSSRASSAASAASSQGSKAARKKRKYRARAKQKVAEAAAAASGGAADATMASGEPLPPPGKGALIQVMEE